MAAEPADLVIINANELVTLDSKFGAPRIGKNLSELAIIRDGAVAIKGEKIVFIGTTKELQHLNLIDAQRTIVLDATDKLVTPGFVDPHVHLVFAGSRENELAMKLAGKSYLEILAAGGGILRTVRETRNASFETLVANGRRILDRMLEHGTTTIEAKSGYGLSVEGELKSLRVIRYLQDNHPVDLVPTFLGAHAIPPEYSGRTEDYIQLIVSEMLPKIANEQLAEFIDVFCEKGIFSIEETRTILLEGEKFGLKKIVHIDEIVDTNGAKLAAELKAVQVGHLLQSNDEGLKALAEAGVIATLLPGTPFCLMLQHYAPARKMIQYGVPIALATDLNPNCWTESMLMILVLSCYNMKLTPAEALAAATINAACAINRQDQIGSLEVGKQADLVIFEVPNHQFLPYHFGINLVETVIKKGVIVIDKKRMK